MLVLNFKRSTQFLALGALSFLATACFEQGFSINKTGVGANQTTPGSNSTSVTTGTGPTATPPPGTGTQTAITFRTLQPALAVRGASCLMCHAQVSANVISDFGFGNSYFFDKDKGTAGFYSDWYDGDVNSGSASAGWGTSVIRGSMIVPQASMDHTFAIVNAIDPNRAKTSLSLADVVTSPRRRSDNSIVQPGMMTGVSPPAGSAAVIEKKTVYIGAPTESEILSLAPELTSAGFKSVSVNGITPDPALVLAGLQLVTVSGGSYVTNSPSTNFVCAGDVVVRGTLFLNNVTVKTNNNGCRLYVSGSVFVQGPVKYVGTSLTTANLQITSSNMIAMGFDLTSLKRRLSIDGDRSGMMFDYTTRSTLAPGVRHNALAAEAALIPSLQDAGDDTSANAQNAYTGLLLNAPEVHSRYVGNFKGAVVAEIAMFRLSEFIFTFDSTFQSVPILPALKSDILSFTD